MLFLVLVDLSMDVHRTPQGLWTDQSGCADFLADGGTVAIWI
jgi:hypothetical protein